MEEEQSNADRRPSSRVLASGTAAVLSLVLGRLLLSIFNGKIPHVQSQFR